MIVLLILLTFLPVFGKECRVETREVIRAVYGSGYVKSYKQVLLRASVSGYVKRVLVKEGDRVRKGDLVAVIDSRGLENRILSIERRIELLKERLRPDSSFMESLRIRVRMAEENLEKARKRFERRKELYRKGVIPRESLEEAERLFRLAEGELKLAQKALEDRVKELRAELGSLIEEKKALEKELDSYRIRSPLEGVVLKVFVQEGDYVNYMVENRVAEVGTLEKRVVLNVDEEFFPLIKKGQEVYIRSDAFPGKVFRGRVVSFDLRSDKMRRLVRVEADADIPENIPVGSVVEGNIVVDRLKTTVVPLEAVKDRFAVLLVDGKERKVKVSRVFEGYAEVLGFPPGTPCLVQD